MAWKTLLVAALTGNAVLGFGYRLFRLTKGGPLADVIGQAILGAVLAGIAVAVAAGADAGRWLALAYGLLFGIVVMPVWVLGVLIPLRPKAVDLAFTALYWGLLAAVVVGAIAL